MDWLTAVLGVAATVLSVVSLRAHLRDRERNERARSNPEQAVRISWIDADGDLVTKTFVVNFDDLEEVDRFLDEVGPLHRIGPAEIVRPPLKVREPVARQDLAHVG